MSRVTHVVPFNDVINHDTSSAEPTCPCAPDVQTSEHDGTTDYALTHHSMADQEQQQG